MSNPSLEDLYETIRGVGLDIITYDNGNDSESTYAETRRLIVSNFGNDALPSLIFRHRTGRELRSASQDIGGYKERRNWFNASINLKLDELDTASTSTSTVSIPSTAIPAAPPIALQNEILFPRYVHSDLVTRCEEHFNNGDYDTCLFKAFRLIEIKVRSASRLEATDVGVNLISKAFLARGGQPLIKLSDIEAEQEGYHALFRGALGSLKNPLSHREVGHSDRARTAELIGFASTLLYLIDNRLQ